VKNVVNHKNKKKLPQNLIFFCLCVCTHPLNYLTKKKGD
jgi:hypothetical protein